MGPSTGKCWRRANTNTCCASLTRSWHRQKAATAGGSCLDARCFPCSSHARDSRVRLCARLPRAPDAPPPATSARLIGQAPSKPRLQTGGRAYRSGRQRHFRIGGVRRVAAPTGGGGEVCLESGGSGIGRQRAGGRVGTGSGCSRATGGETGPRRPHSCSLRDSIPGLQLPSRGRERKVGVA